MNAAKVTLLAPMLASLAERGHFIRQPSLPGGYVENCLESFTLVRTSDRHGLGCVRTAWINTDQR
jgi:hypothetical protein